MVSESMPSMFKLVPLKRNSMTRNPKNYDSDDDDDDDNSTISGLPCLSPIDSQKSRSSAESISLDGSNTSSKKSVRRARTAATIAVILSDPTGSEKQAKSNGPKGPVTGMFSAKEQNTVLKALNSDMDISLEAMMKATPLLSSDWIRSHKGKVAEMNTNRSVTGSTTRLDRLKDGKRHSGSPNNDFDDESICTNYTDVIDFAIFAATPHKQGSVSTLRNKKDLTVVSSSSNNGKSYGSSQSSFRKTSGGTFRGPNTSGTSEISDAPLLRNSYDRTASSRRPP